MKREQKKELMELKQSIKESVRHGKLKKLQKLVQRYFLMLKPVVAQDKNNYDYRFNKQSGRI